MKALTDQELHYLAMNIVGRQLEAAGYEFMGVNSKAGKNPQFVCLKEKQLHFIVVRSVPFPENPSLYDRHRTCGKSLVDPDRGPFGENRVDGARVFIVGIQRETT